MMEACLFFCDLRKQLYGVEQSLKESILLKPFWKNRTCIIKLFTTIISQCVCQYNSIAPQYNICRQGKEPTIRVVSHGGLHSGKLQPCLQIFDQGGSGQQQQTLKLIMKKATVIVVKSFILQAHIHEKLALILALTGAYWRLLALTGAYWRLLALTGAYWRLSRLFVTFISTIKQKRHV